MHRFYLPRDQCQSSTLTLQEREAHHALRVLRVQPGQDIMVLDGEGRQLTCRILRCERRCLEAEVIGQQSVAAPARATTLYQAILKPKAMEWVLQKATELGVSRIIPLRSRQSVVRVDPGGPKMDKWRWVMIDALKQSQGAWLPQLESPQLLSEALSPAEPAELALVASLVSTNHPKVHLEAFHARHGRLPQSVAVWVGPEGDFTGEEQAAILESGARDMTLGKRTLRAETAALYCLSFLHYELTRDL